MEYNVELVKKIVSDDSGQYLKQAITDDNREDLLRSFSHLAANVVEWAEIEDCGSVLVIGDINGNISCCLARKNRRVICLTDSTHRRNLMIRCQGEDNIIFPKSISDTDEFEVIVVLEGNKECVQLADHLKEHGRMVFSLKNDSEDIKKDFKKGLEEKGLTTVKGYYPYPDSHFMMILIEEGRLDKVDGLGMPLYGAEYVAMYQNDDIIGIENSMLPQKGRDLLIYATKESMQEKMPQYIKYSNQRKACYQIKTVECIDDDQRVFQKKALSHAAEMHLKRMKWSEEYFNKRFEGSKVRLAKSKIINGGIEFEFIEGKKLTELLEDCLNENTGMFFEQIESFFEELDRIEDGYFIKTKEFSYYFGNVELQPELKASSVNNIDLIFQNIIMRDGTYVIIDYEWVFKFPIPLNYIKWRSLFYFFWERNMEERQVFEECKKRLGITENEAESYMKMENHIQKVIYGEID